MVGMIMRWPFGLKDNVKPERRVFTRFLEEKGILTKEEFLEMVRVVDRERKRRVK
jgi:hypothetical protein